MKSLEYSISLSITDHALAISYRASASSRLDVGCTGSLSIGPGSNCPSAVLVLRIANKLDESILLSYRVY